MNSIIRFSCGSCVFFNDVGYKNWGECKCPAPQWALETEDNLSSYVWRDGGIQDLAYKCETYKPNIQISNTIASQQRKGGWVK